MVFHTTNCLDTVIQSLSSLEQLKDWEKDRIIRLEFELRIIQMFLWCSASCDSDAYLRLTFNSIECIWQPDGTSENLHKLAALRPRKVFDKVGEKVLLSKQEIKKHSYQLISKSFTCKALKRHEMQQFLDEIINHMDLVVNCRPDDVIQLLKNQIETLQKKLLMCRNLVEFTSALCLLDCKALDDFNVHVLTWVNSALLCLPFLLLEHVTHGLLGEHESKMHSSYLVDDLLLKVNPCTPEFTHMCFALIKLTKSSSSGILIFEELVSEFVDFVLHNLTLTPEDGLGMLREGLIYLITFFACSPPNSAEDYSDEWISQIDEVLNYASSLICMFGEAKVDFSNEKMLLAQLVNTIDQVRGEIDKHCVHIRLSTWSRFPRTDGLGFVERLLVYLEDLQEVKHVPSLKPEIFTIKDKRTSLRLFLLDISELLKEHKELKDLWEEIIGVAYLAEHAIKQSSFIDHPFCLSYVLQKIQAIQSNIVMRVKDIQTYRAGIAPSLTNSATVSFSTLGDDEEVVGFKEETERLIDQLTRGTKELHIVSVVGMGGSGKTTLAKKLYNNTSVTHYFHKRAFCIVSQEYKIRNILLDSLASIIEINDDMRNMPEEDLGDMLRKNLLGHRYLIILDDIWDGNAWHRVKNSFPDEKNGSRVVFTTRNCDVPLNAKPFCRLEQLRFLTIDESWDLLQRKIFHKNVCPPFLFEIAKSIAENCKGLPLSIVVIAGLLAKCERSVTQWQGVADNVTCYASGEGCRGIIELSYKYLPEALKSCFLYLGGFPEDTHYRARDITKLWAAEGFVSKSDRSCVHKVAKGYLNYLGDRSLVIVTERSLAGNIKRFRLHDVIRESCIRKGREEQLICLVNGHDDNFLMPLTYDGYRICVQADCGSFIEANPRGPGVHSLLCFEHVDWPYICSTSSIFRNFRHIEVLELRQVEFQDFPSGITMLVHLRYLAVRYFTRFGPSYVPPTIANLRNLETLFVHGPPVLHLPGTVWRMKRLRHMEFPKYCLFDCLNSVASEGFPQLPDLERLGWVEIRDKEEGEELLRRLPNVRKLSFRCKELPEQLVNLSKLESLSMRLGRKPSVLSITSTLKKLSVGGLIIPGNKLSTMIGKPPCLQVLKLYSCQFPDDKWNVEDEVFPKLKRLVLERLRIKQWEATTDSFPCLEKLAVYRCPSLQGIPLCFEEVHTLRTLKVKYCSEGLTDSARRIEKGQLDLGYDGLNLEIDHCF